MHQVSRENQTKARVLSTRLTFEPVVEGQLMQSIELRALAQIASVNFRVSSPTVSQEHYPDSTLFLWAMAFLDLSNAVCSAAPQ